MRLREYVRRFTSDCKCYIISYDSVGEREEDYSLADTDLMNQINMRVGTYGSNLFRNYSFNQLSSAF